jgi:hypothetical protein
MRRILSTLLVGVFFLACSNDDAAPEGPCAQRSGSYLMKYTERSGTCGKGVENVVNITSQPTTVDPPCSGSISYSADNCEVSYSTTCPNDGAVKGGELTITGKSKWNKDATSGTATETWTLRNPDKTTLCLGTYDVVGTRQ